MTEQARAHEDDPLFEFKLLQPVMKYSGSYKLAGVVRARFFTGGWRPEIRGGSRALSAGVAAHLRRASTSRPRAGRAKMTRRVEIFTRLHKLAETIDAIDLPVAANHYVIGPDLIAAMARDDVQRSITAMIEASMARLPFPELLVEFSVELGVTRFLWLREAPGSIEATTIMLTAQGLATVPTKPARVTIEGVGLQVCDHVDDRDGQAIAIGDCLRPAHAQHQGHRQADHRANQTQRRARQIGLVSDTDAHRSPHRRCLRSRGKACPGRRPQIRLSARRPCSPAGVRAAMARSPTRLYLAAASEFSRWRRDAGCGPARRQDGRNQMIALEPRGCPVPVRVQQSSSPSGRSEPSSSWEAQCKRHPVRHGEAGSSVSTQRQQLILATLSRVRLS